MESPSSSSSYHPLQDVRFDLYALNQAAQDPAAELEAEGQGSERHLQVKFKGFALVKSLFSFGEGVKKTESAVLVQTGRVMTKLRASLLSSGVSKAAQKEVLSDHNLRGALKKASLIAAEVLDTDSTDDIAGKLRADVDSILTQIRIWQQNQKEEQQERWDTLQCPELGSTLKNVRVTLQRSQLPKERDFIDSQPERTPSGVSGSYFVKQREGTSDSGFRVERALVVKPAIQEPGAPGNLEQMADELIGPGKSAMRERIAFKAQQVVGIDCGIPPTGLTTLKHEMFGIPPKVDQLLKDLSRMFGTSIDRAKFLLWRGVSGGIEGVKAGLKREAVAHLEALVASPELLDKLKKRCEEPDCPSGLAGILQSDLFSEEEREGLIKLDRSTVGMIGQYVSCLVAMGKETEVDETLKKISEEFSKIKPSEKEELVSYQAFVRGCTSLGALSPTEVAKISDTEFSKFIIDLVIYNTDRHPGNALLKQVSIAELRESLTTVGGLTTTQIDGLLQVKTLEGFREELRRLVTPMTAEVERVAENLYFAHTKELEYTYDMTLIDHGSSLPELTGGTRSPWGEARYGWRDLPQAKAALSPRVADALKQLDPEKCMAVIQKDQELNQAQFKGIPGNFCRVPQECYHLMRINLMWLKMAAQKGLNLESMSRFTKAQSFEKPFVDSTKRQLIGGEVQEIYLKHLASVQGNPKPAVWKAIEEELSKLANAQKAFQDRQLKLLEGGGT